MPIFEYICQDCGIRFEKLIRRTAETEQGPPCIECGSVHTRRVVSAFARHGAPAVDHTAIQAERTQAERLASITPKEQIEKWRSTPTKKT